MLPTVGSFRRDLRNEDTGVRTAAIFTAGGSDIPASTLMELLLRNDFKLGINKMPRGYGAPRKRKLKREHATEMEKWEIFGARIVYSFACKRGSEKERAPFTGLLAKT